MSNEQQAQFEQMILTLSSNDNVQRTQAESAYADTKKNSPQFLVQALIEVGCNSQNVPAAQMALVLLRKNFTDLFPVIAELGDDARQHIQSSLLTRFGDANTPFPVRKACASAIANLAAKLSQDGRNAWPSLWELLLRTASDEGAQPQLRVMCVEVFAQVATVLVTTYFAPQLPSLTDMLNKCLSSNNAELRTKACECIAEFAHVCEESQIPLMRQTAVGMVNAFVATCRDDTSGDNALLQCTHIRNIVDESDVTYFQDVYPPLLEALYNCAADQKQEGDVRHMSIGTIMSIGAATKAVKGNSVFVKKLFELCFAYMMHPELEPDWEQTYEKEEDEEKTTDFDAGAQGCDRLAHIIKGKAMEALAAPAIMQNVNSDDWKARGAALSLLTYVFEGAAKAFMNHLDMIVKQVVLPRIDDPHSYVRYCAIQCVAQLSSDLCPAFQEKYGAAVLQAVAAKLTNDCPRVMCLAACTLNTFLDELDNSKPDEEEEDNKDPDVPDDAKYESTQFMNPLFKPICDALFACLKDPKPVFVHSECLAALSSTIQLAEGRILPHVAEIVACTGHYLQYPGQGNDATLVRMRSLECVTLTASYVKKDKFPDAANVCSFLLEQLNSGLTQDDMRLRYVLRGWTCMVECLGPDVLPYLAQVMRPLLGIAQSDVDAEMIEKDVGDEELKDTDEVKHVRICVPGKGEKVMRMHTGLIEDKDLAVTILLNFTEELKGHMQPYLNEMTEMAIKLLQFRAMSETRESAAEMLKSLTTTVLESTEKANIDGYIRHVVPPLMEAIDDEAEHETVQVMLGALGGILKKAQPRILPDNLANEAARMMFEIYDLSVKQVEEAQRAKGEKGADEDDVEAAEAAEEEQAEMLQECATCIGQLLRIVPAFFPLFEERFLPMTTSLLNPALAQTQHTIGIQLLCEFIEHGGEPVARHLPNAVDTFKRFAQSPDPAVAQAAIFGLAMCVECAARLPRNEQIGQFIQGTVDLLRQYLNNPQSKHEDWKGVTINAASVAFRIIKHYGDTIDSKALFQLVVENHMPLAEDEDEIESERINDMLVQWMCDSNNQLLGAQSPYRARMLAHLRESPYTSEEAENALKNL